ncbi:hypothetical protein DFQ27_006143 [Actinomortierella ambigua]|uniref:Uncharacterized protein n=1 Tax=Actinomortierella ambigua TaxID=1343610 RepID=A0A9P6QI65_9FUNG|nr:hypothetical protein DFQ27_006143 [Actinomortierella ambigua]
MNVVDSVGHGVHNATELGRGVFKKSKGFFQDAKDFLSRGNAFGLAIAFIMSTALTAVVSSLVDDIITPLFGFASHKNLEEMFLILRCGKTACSYPTRAQAQADFALIWGWGRFLSKVIYFILVGLVLFLLLKLWYFLRRKGPGAKDRPCTFCTKDIPGDAIKCPFCTAWLDEDARRKKVGTAICTRCTFSVPANAERCPYCTSWLNDSNIGEKLERSSSSYTATPSSTAGPIKTLM